MKDAPLYELRPRGKHYQGIWQGEHCLAAICVKKQRGARDAQFLLQAANSHEELLAACEKVLVRFRSAAFMECTDAEDCENILQTAIKKAKG